MALAQRTGNRLIRVDCALCRSELETPVIRQTVHWRTAINRNQNLLGKTMIVLRRHEEAVTALSPQEWADLQDEVVWVTERLRGLFSPDHFNYAFLQNADRHTHLHVVPRYEQPRRFAGLEFNDPDYPDHYRPGIEHRVSRDVIAAMAAAFAEARATPRA
jgi:diadenosine tetraphosphate (Ap4A) HIT family hydrolase